MITILTGTDIFSKQLFLDKLLQSKQAVSVKKYQSNDSFPNSYDLAGQTLFGESVAHIFDNCFKDLSEQYLDSLRLLANSVFLLEDSLDKRTTKVKDLLKLKKTDGVIVKDFPAPAKNQASRWVKTHAIELSAKIDDSAANLLVEYLMGDNVETLSLLQTHQELLKLKSLANGKEITPAMVTALVVPIIEIDVFELMNAISRKQTGQAIKLLDKYYQSQNDDEKSASIRLVALLADQWRSVLIAKDFLERNISEPEILKQTGWKSGRLFIMKKIARSYSNKALVEALTKLSHLDKELKTSTLPSRVIVDMIITSLA